MELIIGVGLLCLSSFIFCAVLIGARNPKQSLLNNEFMIGALYVPFLIIVLVAGAALTLTFLFTVKETAITTGIGMTEDGLAIAMVVATVILIRLTGIKKRLNRFADMH